VIIGDKYSHRGGCRARARRFGGCCSHNLNLQSISWLPSGGAWRLLTDPAKLFFQRPEETRKISLRPGGKLLGIWRIWK